MHAKTDSEGTSQSLSLSLETSWPLRASPPRAQRAVYYVQSPSNHDVEKMSYGSSPPGSPAHHYYHCSPIHHSRESSTSRFSAHSLKNKTNVPPAWKHVPLGRDRHDDHDDEEEEEEEGGFGGRGGCYRSWRLYLCGLLVFVVVFASFCFILWGASKGYKPHFIVKNIVFVNFNVQAGNDQTGVPTDMLSLNSTVKIQYRNPATFFAVHVTSTPLQLYYFRLKLASGQMEKFSQSRKSKRTVVVVVQASQVPLYGGVPLLANARDHIDKVSVPLNLTFVMRSRAYILGRLVKSKFYKHVRCPVILSGKKLGKPLNLTSSCIYD